MFSVSRKVVRIAIAVCGAGLFFWWTADRMRRDSLSQPLLTAVRSGEAETVHILLKQGADPNARVHDIMTSRAILSLLRELLRPGRHARPNAPTALLLAAQYNKDASITRLLLSFGANYELPGEFGYSWQETTSFGTPLIAAACNRNEAIVRVLLEHGVNPNAVSRTKQTALMFAAVKGEVSITQMLLAKGANPNARDIYGNFPLCDAVDWNQRYQYGQQVYAEDGKTPLSHEAAHLRVVKQLLAAGADPKMRYGQGVNALSGAAYGGHTEIVQVLLAQGADPCNTDKEGWTPLHFAAEATSDGTNMLSRNSKIEMIRLLLDAGADIHARTKNGDSALSLDMDSFNQKTSVARFLLSRGANPQRDGNSGREAMLKMPSQRLIE